MEDPHSDLVLTGVLGEPIKSESAECNYERKEKVLVMHSESVFQANACGLWDTCRIMLITSVMHLFWANLRDI